MKTSMNYVVAIALTIVLMVPLSLHCQEWTKEQTEVWKVVEAMWSNWKAGNMEAAFADVHDNYLGWNNESPMPLSKAKWVGSMIENKDSYSHQDYDIEPARIVVQDNCAVVHYYYQFSLIIKEGDESTAMKDQGKWSEFFIKEKGKWMLIGDFTYSQTDE